MSLDDLIGPDDEIVYEDDRSTRRGFWKRIAYTFRERQIYLRSDGSVQFLVVRPWVQILASIFLVAGLLWLAYATVNVAFKDQLIALKDYRAKQTRIAYEDRLASMRGAVERMSGQLLLDQDQYLSRVDQLRSEFEVLIDRHRRLEQFFRQGWLPKRNVAVKPAAEPKPEPEPEAEPASAAPESRVGIPSGAGAPYSNPGFTGKGDFGLRESPASRKGPMLQKGSTLIPESSKGFYRSKYRSAFTSHQHAQAPLRELLAIFAQISDSQLALLDEVEKTSEERIKVATRAIKRIGFNPKRIVKATKVKKLPIGGPYVDANDPAFKDDILGNKMLLAGKKIAQAEKLLIALNRLPIAHPMRGSYRVTSSFGVRSDPFTRRRAMHTGIDFKAPYGHPVRATADGVVIKAGRRGAYGKIVEIRHAHGTTTRYAHLSAIKTRAGRKVKRGQVIGKLGNTGRSTGPHLHYETRIFKKAVSPRRFWKAKSLVR
ncbi:MAG: M23 family metallopeptidase [Hyphomicrobiales bacterium]